MSDLFLYKIVDKDEITTITPAALCDSAECGARSDDDPPYESIARPAAKMAGSMLDIRVRTSYVRGHKSKACRLWNTGQAEIQYHRPNIKQKFNPKQRLCVIHRRSDSKPRRHDQGPRTLDPTRPLGGWCVGQ